MVACQLWRIHNEFYFHCFPRRQIARQRRATVVMNNLTARRIQPMIAQV